MTIKISEEDSNRRLDKFLFAYLNNAPHSFIYKMLRKKRIKLNGGKAEGSEILLAGDELRFFLSDATIAGCRKERIVAEAKPLDFIIFEDGNLLVVNKPTGLPSQGGMKSRDHLLARIQFYLNNSSAAVCNRLDVNTSGLVICGKNPRALQEINALFANRGIKKEYLAVVHGNVGEAGESRLLEDFYVKDEKTNTARISPTPQKDIIITAFEVLAAAEDYSLLSVSPITGRSHQIRVHLAAVGHPIAGDKKYGGSRALAKTQLLHCRRLEISRETALPYPVGTAWEAPPPREFSRLSKELFGKDVLNVFCHRD